MNHRPSLRPSALLAAVVTAVALLVASGPSAGRDAGRGESGVVGRDESRIDARSDSTKERARAERREERQREEQYRKERDREEREREEKFRERDARRDERDGRRGAQALGPVTPAVEAGAEGSVSNDVSVPLRDIRPVPIARGERPEEKIEGDGERHEMSPHPVGGAPDPVAQRRGAISVPGRRALVTGTGFPGPGGDNMTIQYAPPDPSTAVGPNHVLTVVNTSLLIRNKAGTALLGPVPTSTVFSGFAGACGSTNDGDAVVRYDRAADRFVLTQFANAASSTGPYYECLAVSTSGDPTGSWYRYSYSFVDFPDYPKLAVWNNWYAITYNMFKASGSWVGPQVCAYDRTAMLAGRSAGQQCFPVSNGYGSMLAADSEGALGPPAGSAQPVVAMGTSTSLASWKLAVDWATPANSRLTAQSSITVADYTPACSGGSCVPQPGTTNVLDTLADRLMDRLAYRNFGTHEAMVVTHAVTAGSIGVRWYELRLANGVATLYQQGTFVPDATARFMSSAAFDAAGNLGVAYSASSSSVYPSLRATGRLRDDPLGQMTQPEVTLVAGGGSQTGSLRRWGDYASMTVDPVDDCTFWYTGEYLRASGSFNWRTYVAPFTMPGCTAPAGADFALSLSAAKASIAPGASTSVTVTTANTAPDAQPVTLSLDGLPTGATATFSPASLTSGQSATLTITTDATTPTGVYPLTVTATGDSVTRTATFTLTVTAPDFTVSVAPSATTLGRSTSTTATVSTVAIAGTQTVTLSATGLPSGVTASFSPASVTSGSSATLTLTTSSTATLGTSTVTVRGTGTAGTRTASYTLTVSPLVNPGFEVSSTSLSGWTVGGTTGVSSSPVRSGRYAGRAGSTARTNGDSVLTQTFTAPAGTTQVSFWYRVSCPDTVRYDWVTASLLNVSTNKTTTILAKTCTNTGSWVQVSAPVTAGTRYTLRLISHDDNITADPTYTVFDDVTVS